MNHLEYPEAMGYPQSRISLRAVLSLCAALLAVVLCVARGHVQIVLSDPDTYASLFQHRCGLLMVGCVTWALFEMTWRFRSAQLR